MGIPNRQNMCVRFCVFFLPLSKVIDNNGMYHLFISLDFIYTTIIYTGILKTKKGSNPIIRIPQDPPLPALIHPTPLLRPVHPCLNDFRRDPFPAAVFTPLS